MDLGDFEFVRWPGSDSPLSEISLALLRVPCLNAARLEQGWLSESEAAEAADLPPGRREGWLHGRLAAKAAWAAARGLDAGGLTIVRDESGRPLGFDSEGRSVGSFSISHTRGLAAGAFVKGAGAGVGVDLERLDRALGRRAGEFAFSAAELELAAKAPGRSGQLALWCAKEAAGKSWGLGLLNWLAAVRVRSADWNAPARLTVEFRPEGRSPRAAEVGLLEFDGWLLALARESA